MISNRTSDKYLYDKHTRSASDLLWHQILGQWRLWPTNMPRHASGRCRPGLPSMGIYLADLDRLGPLAVCGALPPSVISDRAGSTVKGPDVREFRADLHLFRWRLKVEFQKPEFIIKKINTKSLWEKPISETYS